MASFLKRLLGGDQRRVLKRDGYAAAHGEEANALFLRPSTPDAPGRYAPYTVEVVGEASYQRALESVVGLDDVREVNAILIPEPANPHDPNAIAVYAERRGSAAKVGYLPRASALSYRQDFQALRGRGFETAACQALIVGGPRYPGEQMSFGTWLNMGAPGAILPPPE